MRKHFQTTAIVAACLLWTLFAMEAFAQGHGNQRGGRGRAAHGQNGCGGQTGTTSQQCQRNGMGPQQRSMAGQDTTRQRGMGQGRMRHRYGANQSGANQSGARQSGHGQSRSNRRGREDSSTGQLSRQEIESVLLMREEEKLARDVYVTLGETWNVAIFANIAQSESRHMAAMARLIQRHNLTDPVVDNTVGVFSNSKFTQLYQDLVRTGSVSLQDAYGVGVQIEELDIADLKEGLTSVTHSDVQRVYGNLLRGSQNHLRAFTSQR